MVRRWVSTTCFRIIWRMMNPLQDLLDTVVQEEATLTSLPGYSAHYISETVLSYLDKRKNNNDWSKNSNGPYFGFLW
jgi:hypothetical protein